MKRVYVDAGTLQHNRVWNDNRPVLRSDDGPGTGVVEHHVLNIDGAWRFVVKTDGPGPHVYLEPN